jgi:tRNA-splicing ligase RtcB
MKRIEVEGAKKPIFSWASQLEDSALEQLKVIAKLPFVEHCAIMPDGHQGASCPIGSVIACKDVVIPNFVGVDANCGMGALRTNLKLSDFDMEKRKIVHHAITRAIPVGFSHNTDDRRMFIESKYSEEIKYLMECFSNNAEIIKDRKEVASQLGTLGGG